MKSDYAERKFTVMWLEQRLLADLGGGAVDLQWPLRFVPNWDKLGGLLYTVDEAALLELQFFSSQ